MFNARIPAILNPWFGRVVRKQESVKENLQFTQAELQQLSALLKLNSKVTNEVVQELKHTASLHWQYADKSNANTVGFFTAFSAANRNRKQAQKHLRKLEKLQGKLKRMLRG